MSVLFLSLTITCTNTHTHTPSDASTWKWNQVGGGGARRGQGTHTLIQKHTRTLLICMLRRCPLTSTCACLCSAACSRYLSSSRCRPPRKQPKNTQFLAEETCRASKQDRQKAACHTTPAPCACFCVQRNYKTCVFVHHWCQKPKHPGFIRVWSEKTSQVVTSAASLYLSALCVCVCVCVCVESPDYISDLLSLWFYCHSPARQHAHSSRATFWPLLHRDNSSAAARGKHKEEEEEGEEGDEEEDKMPYFL